MRAERNGVMSYYNFPENGNNVRNVKFRYLLSRFYLEISPENQREVTLPINVGFVSQ